MSLSIFQDVAEEKKKKAYLGQPNGHTYCTALSCYGDLGLLVGLDLSNTPESTIP